MKRLVVSSILLVLLFGQMALADEGKNKNGKFLTFFGLATLNNGLGYKKIAPKGESEFFGVNGKMGVRGVFAYSLASKLKAKQGFTENFSGEILYFIQKGVAVIGGIGYRRYVSHFNGTTWEKGAISPVVGITLGSPGSIYFLTAKYSFKEYQTRNQCEAFLFEFYIHIPVTKSFGIRIKEALKIVKFYNLDNGQRFRDVGRSGDLGIGIIFKF